MSALKLLSRLEKARSTGPSRWIASCPAHVDRTPSLSIREVDDGCVLVNCFGGCAVEDVVAAVGLSLADLFPRGPVGNNRQNRIPAGDLLQLIDGAAVTVGILGCDLLERKTISDADWALLASAVSRIGRARDYAR